MLYTGFDFFRKTFCRDDRIRTCGPYVPNVVRYRAALHPVIANPCKCSALVISLKTKIQTRIQQNELKYNVGLQEWLCQRSYVRGILN